MNEKETTKISRFLSLVLRHEPERINIKLDINGWTDVTTLLSNMNKNNLIINIDDLKFIVENNNKKRFSFNNDFTKIRASQGHSTEHVEMSYETKEPPEYLYHGTSVKSLDSIMANGILKQNRHHVHLSDEDSTASIVGGRHGKAVVLKVKALEMFKNNINFYLSDNNVWLTDEVKPEYIIIHGLFRH